jgi:hypothetical protein
MIKILAGEPHFPSMAVFGEFRRHAKRLGRANVASSNVARAQELLRQWLACARHCGPFPATRRHAGRELTGGAYTQEFIEMIDDLDKPSAIPER